MPDIPQGKVDRKSLLVVLPFCGLFVALGAWITVTAVPRIREGVAATAWPTAAGVVESFAVVPGVPGKQRNPPNDVEVRYTYAVDGRLYTGTRLHPAFSPSSGNASFRRLAQKLLPGTTVAVHYDPDDPGRSTLAAGLYRGSLFPVTLGLMFVVAGVAFGLLSLPGLGTAARVIVFGLLFAGVGVGFWFMFLVTRDKHDFADDIRVVTRGGNTLNG